MKNINWGMLVAIGISILTWIVIVWSVVLLVGCSPQKPYIPAL